MTKSKKEQIFYKVKEHFNLDEAINKNRVFSVDDPKELGVDLV